MMKSPTHILRTGSTYIDDLVDGVFAGSLFAATNATAYYVNSVTGASGNSGLSKDEPLATIDQAINKCTADAEDVIYVMPNHVEAIDAATDLVVDVNSINIIGLGTGQNRPILRYDGTAGRIPVSADNVTISNVIFMASIASIVSGVTVTGTYNEFHNCEWNFDATGIEFLQMLDIDTGDYTLINNCKFVAENIAGCNNAIRIDNSPGAAIRNCTFRGDYTTACITGVAGSAAASVDLELSGCFLENKDTTAGTLVDMTDTSTGIITNNRGFTLFTTNITAPWDGGNCLQSENYVVNAVDETGAVSPTTAST
jgi:hypothetical protein